MKARSGFTLVELMVVVTIVAILAVVAVFAYGKFVDDARLGDGAALLNDIRMKQESFFATYSRYVSSTTDETAFDGEVLSCPGNACEGMYQFEPECSGGNPWCDLGFKPSGFAVADVADHLQYFQVQTIAWAPGMTGSEPDFIADTATRWWSMQARGLPVLDDGTKECTVLRLTNESRELIRFHGVTPCE